MPHLYLAITAHGYGHLAQSSPVVEELHNRIPDLHITLQGNIDPLFAKRRLPSGFAHVAEPADVGLVMDGPLRISWEESLNAYRDFEARYDEHLQRQLTLLEKTAPDLVLSDVPWGPLDAAHRLGIPAVAICSLSWYDILVESPIGDSVPPSVAHRLISVYSKAEKFLRPLPSMPMTWLPNAVDIGPIARRRRDRSADLRKKFGIPAAKHLILVHFGGVQSDDIFSNWPKHDNIQWLIPEFTGLPRKDITAFEPAGLGVLDVLGSCEAILSKAGYGTVTEAACNGKPALFVCREDWAEEPVLTAWLRKHVPVTQIRPSDLKEGQFLEPLLQLIEQGCGEPIQPTGIDEGADILEPYLRSGRKPERYSRTQSLTAAKTSTQ